MPNTLAAPLPTPAHPHLSGELNLLKQIRGTPNHTEEA